MDNKTQELDKEQINLLRVMLESEAMRTCQVLWAKLSIRKEQEKAQALRVHQMDDALYLQGFLDGMKAKDNAIKNAISQKKIEESPLY